MSGEMSFLTLSGGQVEYRDVLPEQVKSGVTLIMQHDGLGCAATWRNIPDRLARETGCRVIAPSRFGYGGSSPCDLPRPLDFMQTEGRFVLPELLDVLKIGRHIVIGHSDGGSITLAYAGSAPRAGLMGIVTIAAHVFCETVCVEGIAKTEAEYEAGPLKEALARYHNGNVDCAFHGWAGAWQDPEFRNWNIENILPGITVPGLIIQGRQDEYGTLEQVDRIVAGIGPLAVQRIIENCGHSPHREQADELVQSVATFVQQLVA